MGCYDVKVRAVNTGHDMLGTHSNVEQVVSTAEQKRSRFAAREHGIPWPCIDVRFLYLRRDWLQWELLTVHRCLRRNKSFVMKKSWRDRNETSTTHANAGEQQLIDMDCLPQVWFARPARAAPHWTVVKVNRIDQ